MQSLLKQKFSTVMVTATLLAMGPLAVSASEHKYPIFKRKHFRTILGHRCKGDKELVWTQGEEGEAAPRLCREKCPADWITTKKFCIKDKSVSFPRRNRYIAVADPCDNGEVGYPGNFDKRCVEKCPEGMTTGGWCGPPANVEPSAKPYSLPFNQMSICPPGMERATIGDYEFCLKPLKAK